MYALPCRACTLHLHKPLVVCPRTMDSRVAGNNGSCDFDEVGVSKSDSLASVPPHGWDVPFRTCPSDATFQQPFGPCGGLSLLMPRCSSQVTFSLTPSGVSSVHYILHPSRAALLPHSSFRVAGSQAFPSVPRQTPSQATAACPGLMLLDPLGSLHLPVPLLED